MASLITYGTNVAATSLTSAGKLATTTGGTGGTVTVAIGTASGYGELCALGTASAWPSLSSLPAPTGKGWLLDSTLLNSQTFLAGNWTPTFKSKISAGTLTADVYIRAFAYDTSALTYTAIGTCILTAQSWSTTAANYNFLATLLAEFSFNATQRLYIDCWPNVTSNSSSAGSTFTVNLASTGATGVAGDMQMTTPNYVSLGMWSSSDNLSVSDSFLAVEYALSTDGLSADDSLSSPVQVAFSTDSLSVSDSFLGVQDALSIDGLSVSDSSFIVQDALSSDNLTVSDAFLATLQVFSTDSVPVSDSFLALSVTQAQELLSVNDSWLLIQDALSVDALAVSDSGSSFLSLGMMLSSDTLVVSDSWLLCSVAQSGDGLSVSDAWLLIADALSVDALIAGDSSVWIFAAPPSFWQETWLTRDMLASWLTRDMNAVWET